MPKRQLLRIGKSKRRRLRPLQFDTLEDRRLLAGLTVSVFEDVDASGDFDGQIDNIIAGRVVFVDSDRNGQLDHGEAFAISGDDGRAVFASLGQGTHFLEVLGQPRQEIQLEVAAESADLDLAVASVVRPLNQRPSWKSDVLSFQGTEDKLLSVTDLGAKSLDQDGDNLFYFISTAASFGTVKLSNNGSLEVNPDTDFDGTDSFQVKSFDGYDWSEPVTIEVKFQSVDDLPVAFNVVFEQTVPENTPGAILGTYTIEDVDGGIPSFAVSNPSAIEIANGVIRLAPGFSLDFEDSSQFSISVTLQETANSEQELSRTANIEVLNTNDLSEAIVFSGVPEVQEFRKGHRFGTVGVIDQDQNEQFTWQVSDSRFTVNDRNELRLLQDAFLVSSLAAFVPIILTATSVSGGDSVSLTMDIGVKQGPPPFQNQSMPLDVNDDGEISGLDLLAIVNALNTRRHARDLSGPPPEGSFDYIDANGDRFLSALDLLVVVNYLSNRRKAMSQPGGVGNAEGERGGSSGSLNRETVTAPSSSIAAPLTPAQSTATPTSTSGASGDSSYAAAFSSYEYEEKLRRKR